MSEVLDPTPWFPDAKSWLSSFETGRCDAQTRLQFIYSTNEARISEDGAVLFVGTSGADGIEFCFRTGFGGVWAYYPIDNHYIQVASDIGKLEEKWLAGEISL